MGQLVTREGRLFQVSDANGDFTRAHAASGLYAHNTRFLALFEVRVNGATPRPLAASVAEDDIQRVWAQAEVGEEAVPHGAPLAVQRRRVLDDAAMYERITVTNYGRHEITVELELRFAADYADVFEVRGLRRPARGRSLPVEVDDRAGTVTLGYLGLDGVTRRTTLRFNLVPASLDAARASWRTPLAAQGSVTLDVTVGVAETAVTGPAASAAPHGQPGSFDTAFAALRRSYADWRASCTVLETDDQALQTVLDRSALDLRLLLADLGDGPFPVAGIPWFAVPFGRDSLIAAIQALPLTPDLARGTLRTLAALQGREVNARRQEEPGKIPHELRRGEMANLGEVPFGRYYGSVDSTPLFLVLLCDYDAWTGDLALARELLPNIRAALHWIDAYGDRDGDLLLEFEADNGRGLAVQSWKDSADSLSHRDGSLATGAIAVAEAQGYVYDAKRRLAPLLTRLGEHEWAERLSREAEALKERFNAAYWMADRDYLALALDGTKRQVGTVTSDAGHCLWSGIVDAEKAAPVARRLVAPDLFSGWGIRTLATGEISYNPMSYHNGSVWPHDTSLCALGLKRYGYDRAANAVAMAVVAAARRFPDARLPELYCGFDAADGLPVPYPLACSPQAWAAGAPLALVRAMLGLEPDAAAGVLRLRPCLPDGVGRLSLRGLRVGAATVDLDVTRAGVEASIRSGTLDVVVESPTDAAH